MATMDWYGKALLGQWNGSHPVDFDTDTIKVAVLDSGHTPNVDTHEFWSDVSADEVAAQGDYTTGGVALSSKTATYDAATDRVILDAADLALTTTITGRYLVVYKDTGTASTSPLLGIYDNVVDFGGGSSLSITWDATGVLRLTRV